MAVHKELGSGHSKKKMSRLKRIILRERADKAATQAGTAAEQAVEGLAKSRNALDSLQKQLKVICWTWFVPDLQPSMRMSQCFLCAAECSGQQQNCYHP